MMNDYHRHPIDIQEFMHRPRSRARDTTRACKTHLTNDARVVVDIEDAIVIEDVVGAVIARRRLMVIH